MHYVGRRASETNPLRSIPLFRTVESVLGPSALVKAEAEARIAREHLAAELAAFATACVALGKANRMPVDWQNAGPGCRRYHQAASMRLINARRSLLRAAQRRLRAAEAALLAAGPVALAA